MDQKKGLHLKKCANFHELRGETTKKESLLQNLQKTVLAHEFWGDNQYLGSLRSLTALQWHRACYFFWSTIFAWGAQAVIWGDTAPECPPWRRACCNFTAIYRTATIAFSLKRYCLKSVLLKKWELFKVTKRYPKPFSKISYICENTI